ncbi:MAG: sulfur oxidation c-type cytochrome SoxX [Alphaproteobacteria bacterium]|nr:MAG: sulfur oxidation c-type cytochrome SoxX [Alphaproteobacteria bacterium]
MKSRALWGIALAVGMAGAAGAAERGPVTYAADINFAEDGSVAESLTGKPGNPENGAQVLAQKKIGNCIACHQVTALKDYPFHGEIGPSLDGVGSRYSEAQLRGILVDAKKTFEGSMMPSFFKTGGFIRPGIGFTGKPAKEPLPPLLTAEQIEDAVAFLMTLKDE